MYDRKTNNHPCALCSGRNLRYHFELKNDRGESAFVGSSCILKFEINFFGTNVKHKLSEIEKRKYLDHLISKARTNQEKQHVQTRLEKLGALDKEVKAEQILKYYRKNKKFGPKYLCFIFWRLKENRITFRKSAFVVNLKDDKHKEEYLSLKDFQRESLVGCKGLNIISNKETK